MQCGVCQHDNRPDARFCASCGSGLAYQCPACAAPYEPGERFCTQCGTALPDARRAPVADAEADAEAELARYVPAELLRKIRSARAGQAMRGERRTVTMLFADIQGSTAAAEGLDPEEWAEIINGAFAHLIAPVYRYEGTLARLQGDAILAFFGAPIAHEDDPARAARAGLEIVGEVETYRERVRSRNGVDIDVRVGINTGLVVVGEVGSDLRVEYTALGDAINVAARMEQTAAPGTVQITEDTLALLGGEFDTVPVGLVEVKGRHEPVATHRIVRYAATSPSLAGDDRPLVGRDDELVRLVELVDRLVDGRGAICTLTGEAGIGKSRLLTALQAHLADHGALATRSEADGATAWLYGSARSWDTQVPHAIFADLLRRWWGIEDAVAAFDAIDAAVTRASGAHDPDTAGLLGTLLDVPVPDDQSELVAALPNPLLHRRTADSVAAHLSAEARRRPIVVVLDDLHWGDSVSLSLVERLMDVTESDAILLLLVLRPVQDDPAWRLVETAARDHPHRYESIVLERLPDAVTERLLDALLSDRALADDVREHLIDRANGNPLFVEQIVRSLDDAGGEERRLPGASEVSVPPSLAGLLTARLDRLDEDTRHVAQVAAVIGREFDRTTLAAVVDDANDLDARLHDLLRRGILEEQRRVPVPVYAFRHALIQDTAYTTVLLRSRRDLHGRIARHLEAHRPDDVQAIARHHVEAGDATAAFPHLVAAGQRATRAMALSDAITWFSLALDATPADADPDLVLAAHDGLGEAYGLVPDLSRAAAAYQKLLDYGQAIGAPSMQVAALNRLGFSTATIAGDLDGAMAYLDDARRLAEEVGDDLGLAEYHMNACMVTSFQGNFEQALTHDIETARLGRLTGNNEVRLTGLLRSTMNLLAGLRFNEAREAAEELAEVAREVGNAEVPALLSSDVAGGLALVDGDVRGAIELMRPHLPTLDRFGSTFAAAAHNRMAECLLLAGDVEQALAEYAATERAAIQFDQPYAVPAALAGRAHVLALCGMVDEIPELRARVIALLENPQAGFFSTSAWLNLAWTNTWAGDLGTAAADLDRAAGAWGVTRMWERPRIPLGRARLALMTGDSTAAAGHLDEAAQLITDTGIRVYEQEQFVLAGALAAAEGRDADAVMLLGEADTATAESGRRILRIEALGRLAAVRARLGDAVQARSLRDRAEGIAAELADQVVDGDLRGTFVERLRAHTATLASTS